MKKNIALLLCSWFAMAFILGCATRNYYRVTHLATQGRFTPFADVVQDGVQVEIPDSVDANGVKIEYTLQQGQTDPKITVKINYCLECHS